MKTPAATSTAEPRECLSPADVARILGCSRDHAVQTVPGWFRVGRLLRIDRADFDSFVRERKAVGIATVGPRALTLVRTRRAH